jgi:branched-subunit amino acid aminotransferase/4-amino-4-deoxychorismate lyase
MILRKITRENLFSALSHDRKPWHEDYLAMYSTQWKGYTTDPALMMVPADDHLVHRGDGVFDVIRCLSGKIYQMEAHLSRLEKSARAISLTFPKEPTEIREIIKELVRIGGEKNCLIRIILSRGPGGFTTNPFECPSSQIYINIIRHPVYPEKYYSEGISVVTSRIPIKPSFFATTKSCNYLQNVLMKMEAVSQGFKFSISLDEHRNLAEGSTENVGIVTKEGVLKFPGFDNTLAGITVQRVAHLAETLVDEKILRKVRFDKIPLEEAYESAEVLLTGTSIHILPVVRYDGRDIGTGRPGPVCSRLLQLLDKDAQENHDLLTEINWEADNTSL